MKTETRLARIPVLIFALTHAGHAFAQDSADGKWMLSMDQGRGEMIGLLELERVDERYIGHVEGGPISVLLNGSRITLGVDDRTGAGEPYVRELVGTISGDEMSGRFGPDEPSEFCQNFPLSCDQPSGVWRATRIVEDEGAGQAPPRPVDLSGMWATARNGGGIARFTMDLSPKAEEWVQQFDTEMDLPSQRCVSSGLFRRFTSNIEIMRSDAHLTFLYSVGEARRIYTDGRSAPDFVFPSPLGYSTGSWEGSTLAVTTTHIQPTVRGYRGEPISENAVFEERYTLSDDGMTLSGVLTLHDPENYRKPPMRRRTWSRDPDLEFTLVSCDPDSFYRQLFEDGRMQDYVDRSNRRR